MSTRRLRRLRVNRAGENTISAAPKLQFEKPEREMKGLKTALAVSLPLTIVVAVLTYILHLGYGNYVMLVLASAVQFYAGRSRNSCLSK